MTNPRAEKARRLLKDGRVLKTEFPVTQYTVDGDTGTYVVLVSPTTQMCSCPATARCSHIEACIEHVIAPVETRAKWDAAQERYAREQSRKADEAFARVERAQASR
jgi:hypothetical protein